MPISAPLVAYNNVFANGTVTFSAVGATWASEERITDGLISFPAFTDAAPSGEWKIQVDQGTTVADYFSANRFALPPIHSLAATGTFALEYAASSGGPWTSITTYTGGLPAVPGTYEHGNFGLVTAAAGNRYWRFRGTDVTLVAQFGQVFTGLDVRLGEADTSDLEGFPRNPAPFDVVPNFVEDFSVSNVRSVVINGVTRRRFTYFAEQITNAARADFKAFLEAVRFGADVFFFVDTESEGFFATVELRGRSRHRSDRWDYDLVITEVA